LWVLAACLLTGCVAPGTDFEALPFYRRDRIHTFKDAKGKPTPGIETLSPLLFARSRRSLDGERSRTVWPFPLLLHRVQGEESSLVVLFGVPAILGSSTPFRDAFGMGPSFRDLPLGGYRLNHKDEKGLLDKDRAIMPFMVWGKDKTEGSYFAMMPFGGTTKGLFGKDDAVWVGFPFPIYYWANDEGFITQHVLWPFVNWVKGEGRSGFRVWPFYGHYERRDEDGRKAYDRTWLLWPFVTWQTNGGNLRKRGKDGKVVRVPPTKVLAVLPFFGTVRGPGKKETDVLWPLFRWTRLTKDKAWELRAPFPFVIVGGDEAGRSRWDFWPLFGLKKRPGYVRHFALWPVERYEKREDERIRDVLFSLLPFWQWHSHEDKEEGTSRKRWQLWPFVHYRREKDGTTDLQALSWLFQRNDDFEEIYYPWTRLFRHREIPELGSKETQMLFGLASWRSVRKEKTPEYDRLSLLFGLFQYRRRGRQKALRFFYLPEWPLWGGE